MANSIAYADVFQKTLDLLAVREARTGWMEANAGQVIYDGGKNVKIPKMSVQGLGDYSRSAGYKLGDVTVTYETREMTQDRGRKFILDEMDVNESNFVATAGNVMGEFQRTFVVPEIDAYRISMIVTAAIGAAQSGMIAYGYTPAEATILRKIKEGIKAVREQGWNGPLVIQANDDTVLELEMAVAGKIQSVTFAQGGIDTTVPAVDGVPVIGTPSNRMYSAITLYDGATSGQEAGGYVKGASALDVNFIVLPAIVPLAISKQDKMRIFDPNTYQGANAWSIDYRRYHDLWVKDNAAKGIYVSIKSAQPS